jgi:hypothetical protein
MAYMSQDKKAKIALVVKAILKKYGVKGTLSVHHHSTLVLNIKSGSIDFIKNCNEVCGKDHYQVSRGFQPIKDGHISVNPYHYKSHFSGRALKCISELVSAMYGPDYFDESDPQTDYFHCSHYIDVNIGKWDKPYIVEC